MNETARSRRPSSTSPSTPPPATPLQPSSSLVVRGGRPVGGRLRPSGNKNAALPLLAATLLTDEEVVLSNVPDIGDVRTLLRLLEGLGKTVQRQDVDRWSIHGGLTHGSPDREECARIRASILLAGPLLARCGEVDLPSPGGDVIGRRRLDTHILAFESLGASAYLRPEGLRLDCGDLRGAEIFLDEPSVTGTENAILAAALAQGHTTLLNAASEPHVQELCVLLNAMGARILGIGSNRLEIEGVERLHGARYEVGPDLIEIGSLLALSAATRGELELDGVCLEDLRAARIGFARLGVRFDLEAKQYQLRSTCRGRHTLHLSSQQRLEVQCDLGGAIPKIDDGPWPGFPADLLPLMVVLATQCAGTVLIHEKLFESRLFFTDRLCCMGARLVLCDPHRVISSGPSKLTGQELSSPDIRAGMALLIAALCAEGTSTIHNARQIDRGYVDIVERLGALGADLQRVPR